MIEISINNASSQLKRIYRINSDKILDIIEAEVDYEEIN